MRVQIAFTELPTTPREAFCIARVVDSRCCPVLREPLRKAVTNRVGGMPALLIHRDGLGELRMYGDGRYIQAAVGMELDEQLWADFEIPRSVATMSGSESVA